MKFVSFSIREQLDTTRWGIAQENQIMECFDPLSEYPHLLSFIQGGQPALELLRKRLAAKQGVTYALEEVKLRAPFLPPKNIICIGKNYTEHALEMSNQNPDAIPKHPVIFTKPYTSVIGPEEEIQSYPGLTQELDYEGELVVIMGKRGKDISKEDAFDYIFGYSILNDVTARDLQQQHIQFFKGKSLDTFAPFGPAVVHQSAIENPQSLTINTYVNEERRQHGTTSDMIFSIAELIEVVSRGMTLEPGDMIATGTPSGVGKGFKPPKFIKKGDVVSIEINPIGVLTNPVG